MLNCKTLFVLFLTITLTIITSFCFSQEPKLVARWALDETSGDIAKDSIGKNHGKLIGGPKWTKAKFDNGLLFDKRSNQYVEIQQAPELSREDALTVIVWVNVNSSAGRQEIFCYGDSYVIHIDGGFFKAYIHKAGAFPRASFQTQVETDKWYFLAMTYDSTDLKLYVNGEFDGSARLPGGINILNLPLRFGNNPAAPAEAWGISGILDEVEIWDRPMTEAQIKKAYESPLAFLSVNAEGSLTTTWGKLKQSSY